MQSTGHSTQPTEQPVPIMSLEQLRILASAEDAIDIEVVIRPGVLRSSKRIQYAKNRNGRHWWLLEYESGRFYTEHQLTTQTTILTAIEKHAIFYVPATH